MFEMPLLFLFNRMFVHTPNLLVSTWRIWLQLDTIEIRYYCFSQTLAAVPKILTFISSSIFFHCEKFLPSSQLLCWENLRKQTQFAFLSVPLILFLTKHTVKIYLLLVITYGKRRTYYHVVQVQSQWFSKMFGMLFELCEHALFTIPDLLMSHNDGLLNNCE